MLPVVYNLQSYSISSSTTCVHFQYIGHPSVLFIETSPISAKPPDNRVLGTRDIRSNGVSADVLGGASITSSSDAVSLGFPLSFELDVLRECVVVCIWSSLILHSGAFFMSTGEDSSLMVVAALPNRLTLSGGRPSL